MKELSNYFETNIRGKRILITGGTTGIGRATAELLVSLGAKVVTFGRDKQDFEKAMTEIRSKYPDASIYGTPADVTNRDAMKKIFDIVDNELGGIDILINNSALGADNITKGRPEEWQYILNTNVLGYLAYTEEAVSRMRTEGSGHIVNVGSMSAEVREETGTIYVATKGAIRAFTGSLRKELNPLGIKVTLIEPGAVISDMQPGSEADKQEKIKKMEMLEAEDIAMSIAFCLAQHQRCDVVTMQIRPHLQII
jgi:NADP-dependent 3-hydroxy acid dehydrogenase YdfG